MNAIGLSSQDTGGKITFIGADPIFESRFCIGACICIPIMAAAAGAAIVWRNRTGRVGSVLKGLGYKTAYFGKFEMDKKILKPQPTVNYSTAGQPYGFDVFSAGGDIGSAPRSGFENDPFIAGESVRWLRETASETRRTGQPFFMVASFVNPHDIMFGNGNIPDQAREPLMCTPRSSPVGSLVYFAFSIPNL